MTDQNALIMGFDWGTRHIGMAIGQVLTKTAMPLKSIKVTESEYYWQQIVHAIANWQPQSCVVGLPLNIDGSESPSSKQSRNFARQLIQRSGLSCVFADERFSTYAAHEVIREYRGADIDSIAAAYFLGSWLRSDRSFIA